MFQRRKYDKKTGIYRTKCDIGCFKIQLNIKTLFSLIEISDFDNDDFASEPPEQKVDKWTIKWQEKLFSDAENEYYREDREFETDSEKLYAQQIKEAEPSTTSEDSSKFKIFTTCNEDVQVQEWKSEPDVTDDYPIRKKEPEVTQNTQTFKIFCEYLSEVQCLVSMEWNVEDKTLKIFPDFNNLERDPYLIEFDQKKMILFAFQSITKKRERRLPKLRREPTLILSDYDFAARNSFKILVMVCLETATDFDYDNLHFKYSFKTLNSEKPVKIPVNSTHSSSRGNKGNLINLNHSFEQEFDFNYTELESDESPVIILHLEGYSVDEWGRERYQGFGSLKMNLLNGIFEKEVRFVREIRNGNNLTDWMERFFIGGHRQFNREAFSQESRNRFGTWTKTSGTLSVSFQILIQHDDRHFNLNLDVGCRKFEKIVSIVQRFKSVCKESTNKLKDD